VSAPPNIMPSPTIAMSVIAIKKAVIAPVFVTGSVRSFKLAPQRLQKLRPGVIRRAAS